MNNKETNKMHNVFFFQICIIAYVKQNTFCLISRYCKCGCMRFTFGGQKCLPVFIFRLHTYASQTGIWGQKLAKIWRRCTINIKFGLGSLITNLRSFWRKAKWRSSFKKYSPICFPSNWPQVRYKRPWKVVASFLLGKFLLDHDSKPCRPPWCSG